MWKQDYDSYARELGLLPTGIHTNIDSRLRLSSIYRRYANENFESWAWETLLFNDGVVEEQYDTLQTADQVVNLHAEIRQKLYYQ
ncbi:MAG: hypothetical protein WD512_01415 [Candidatus Paceibacterota bacterium]